MNTQYKKGVVELCVLALLMKRDCYGYEISERLAAQFEDGGEGKKSGGAGLIVAGVCLADLFGGMVYALMAAFALVLGAAAAAFAVVGLCLIAGLDMGGLIPSVPGAGALIVGLALMALSGLTACGCVWYAAFLRQIARGRADAGERAGGGSWAGDAAESAVRATLQRESLAAAAQNGARVPDAVCGAVCDGLYRAGDLGGQRSVLARLGLVRLSGIRG